MTLKKERKVKSKSITARWEYDDRVVIHTKVTRQPDVVYFSGNDKVTNWDNANNYIDLAPKGNFIARFVKRLWNLKKLEKILSK